MLGCKSRGESSWQYGFTWHKLMTLGKCLSNQCCEDWCFLPSSTHYSHWAAVLLWTRVHLDNIRCKVVRLSGLKLFLVCGLVLFGLPYLTKYFISAQITSIIITAKIIMKIKPIVVIISCIKYNNSDRANNCYLTLLWSNLEGLHCGEEERRVKIW